jgi:hypothetical protein
MIWCRDEKHFSILFLLAIQGPKAVEAYATHLLLICSHQITYHFEVADFCWF